GTISKEGADDPVVTSHAGCQGVAGRDRNEAGHDRRAAHEAYLWSQQMHRATLTARTAGILAVELGKHPREIPALGDIDAMAAVRPVQVVGRTQRPAHPGGYRFLADGQVNGALDLIGRIDLNNPLLGQSDLEHEAIE